MRELHDVDLSTLTTLRVGGVADRAVEAFTRSELVDVVSTVGGPGSLILGQGSNVVVSDEGLRTPVIAVRTTGVAVDRGLASVTLSVAAGEDWDALVAMCVHEGWSGVEALSGIPGTVGATPIQNVGAYGQEVCDVISSVAVYDRVTSTERTLTSRECQFRYRSSLFKDEPERYVVLDVELQLPVRVESGSLQYAELATRLGVARGGSAPIAEVRDGVLDLRRSKGMVLDAADHDTWSAGSFFTNPILERAAVPADAPTWPHGNDLVKTSAAWLIERSGFAKGFGAEVGRGRARLSSKHTLAVTNHGGATTEDVLLLARTVRQGVLDRFGVLLQPEPTLVGVEL